MKPEDFLSEAGSIRIMEDFDLDVFTRMREKRLDYFRSRLRLWQTRTVRIPYLAPQDLIFLKEVSWRDKDKLDVLAMKEIIARENR